MLDNFLIKGVFIGFVFGIPIGVVGVLTIQRTIRHDMIAGIISGLGASTADIFYASISIFGLTFISDLLIKNQVVISSIGGIFIIFIGYRIMIQKISSYQEKETTESLLSYYISSFIITLTNPVSILSFMFIFSTLGIYGTENYIEKISLLLGILIGTGIWWIVISFCTSYLKEKMKEVFFMKLNKIFGITIIILGIFFIVRVVI